jgi:hypothetical protein
MQPDVSTNVNVAYAEMYEVLNAANNIIGAVPDLPQGSDDRKNTLLGQALAIRALVHFDLLRFYAQPFDFTPDGSHTGIVIRTAADRPVIEEQARSSVSDAYSLIIEDLERAIILLPPYNNPYYIRAEAAKALLARVYLYTGDYSRAAALAGEVINSQEVRLATRVEYPGIWNDPRAGVEYLFVLDMSAPANDLLAGLIGEGAPNPAFTASSDLLQLYTAADIRGPGGTIIQDENDNYLTAKYPHATNMASDIPVIRLSEVYLIRAEAFARLSRPELAQADLDAIRARAIAGYVPDKPQGQALIEAIINEKRKELAFEGHYFFTLRRTGSDVIRSQCPATGLCDLLYPDYRFVLPIPREAIEANRNLTQNQGY